MIEKSKISQTLSSLKTRNFRLYITGQFISTIGTWMQSIGQAWLVLKITNSGTALGLVMACQTLPVLFFGPFGGVIADRFLKRNLLFITQSIAGLLALTLGILVYTNLVQIWMVYLLALGLGLVNAFDNPARQTFIPEMVAKDQLMNAVSLNSIQVNLSRVIGPTIAAVLIASFGLAPLFFFNALSFVAVIVTLYQMDIDKLNIRPMINRVKGQMIEGIRYIKSTPILFYTLVMMAIIGTLTYEFGVTLPLLAKFTFHGTASTYALLSAALGLGSVLGGIYTANRKKVSFSILTKNAMLFGVVVLLFAFSPTFWIALLLLISVGFFSINFLSFANVILQTNSIPEMRGRVMSFWAVAFLGTTPIGGPIIGWIGQNIGTRIGVMVGGVAALVASGIGMMAIKRNKDLIMPPNTNNIDK